LNAKVCIQEHAAGLSLNLNCIDPNENRQSAAPKDRSKGRASTLARVGNL